MGASLAKAKAPHGLVCRQLGLNGVPAGANPTFGETKTLDYISSFSVKKRREKHLTRRDLPISRYFRQAKAIQPSPNGCSNLLKGETDDSDLAICMYMLGASFLFRYHLIMIREDAS